MGTDVMTFAELVEATCMVDAVIIWQNKFTREDFPDLMFEQLLQIYYHDKAGEELKEIVLEKLDKFRSKMPEGGNFESWSRFYDDVVSEPLKELALRCMYSLAKGFDNWKRVYDVAADSENSEMEEAALEKLSALASGFNQCWEVFELCEEGSLPENTAITKLEVLDDGEFNDWLDIYKGDYSETLQDIALKKLKAGSYSFEEWYDCWRSEDSGSCLEKLATEKMLESDDGDFEKWKEVFKNTNDEDIQEKIIDKMLALEGDIFDEWILVLKELELPGDCLDKILEKILKCDGNLEDWKWLIEDFALDPDVEKAVLGKIDEYEMEIGDWEEGIFSDASNVGKCHIVKLVLELDPDADGLASFFKDIDHETEEFEELLQSLSETKKDAEYWKEFFNCFEEGDSYPALNRFAYKMLADNADFECLVSLYEDYDFGEETNEIILEKIRRYMASFHDLLSAYRSIEDDESPLLEIIEKKFERFIV